jgi:iron complex transport system substrate-binding protein
VESDAASEPGTDTPATTDVTAVVATEGRRDLDIALSLGLPLVGFPRDGETPDAVPRFDAELSAAEDAGAQQLFLRNEINIEAVAAQEPDLILGRDEDLAELPELSDIAPVIALGSVASDVAWQDDLTRVAEATGTQAQAEEVLARYRARLEEVRTTHADALGARVLMAATADDGGLSLSGSRLAVRVLADLGATFSPAMAAVVPDGEADYSLENIGDALADADLVVLVANGPEVPVQLQTPHVLVDKYVNEGGPLTAISFLDTLDELYAQA